MPGKLGKGGKGSNVPWDRSSYSKAWANALAAVAKDRQELEGIWLRDLRKIARTYMVGARVHPDVIRKIMGHADRKAEDRYFVPTVGDLQAGLSVLSLDAVWDACQEGQSGRYVTTADKESRKSRAS